MTEPFIVSEPLTDEEIDRFRFEVESAFDRRLLATLDARPALPTPEAGGLDVEALAFAMCTALHPHWTKAKTDTEGHRLGHGEDARVIAAEYAAILAAKKDGGS